MDNIVIDRIHTLWDELADFDAADADRSLDHLLTSLCQIANAPNAVWFGAVHLADILPGDPVHGWRPSCIHSLYPSVPLQAAAQEQSDLLEQSQVDITTIRNVALAGRLRANRIVYLVSEDWFESDYYQQVDRSDAIWAGIPINDDTENPIRHLPRQ